MCNVLGCVLMALNPENISKATWMMKEVDHHLFLAWSQRLLSDVFI